MSEDDFVDISICEGPAHAKILESAGMLGADLVVLGTMEGEGLRFLGSTTDRVLRGVHCPVWVVSGDSPLPPRKVLAPVDLSELSADCLIEGVRLLGEILDGESFEMEILFVLTTQEILRADPGLVDQLEQMALEELQRFAEGLDFPVPVHPTCRVSSGEVRTGILREVQAMEPDLVILGTHGRSGFERYLLGSVAADVAGRSPRSVLVVPPEDARREFGRQAILPQNDDLEEPQAMVA